MSKPGFPTNMVQDTVVTNTYRTWDGLTFNGNDTLSNYRTRYEDKSGSNTPGWPNAIRSNDYLRSIFTWQQEKLTVNGTNNIGGGHIDSFDGDWGNSFGLGWSPWGDGGATFSLDAEVNNVYERLIGKLIDNIQSHRVNSGEVLHTRGQTASMVASTANRFAGAIFALRKGNFAGAARYLTGADPRTRKRIRASGSGRATSWSGGIPEQWLALKYGWLPALQDVYNSCEIVRKAWNDNGDLFSAEASSRTTGSKLQFVRDRTQPHGPTFKVETTSREVSGKASVTYGVDSALGSSLSQLGITNPLSLAWELLPWSFVLDWLYPVGSFLERLDYTRGLYFKHGWVSIRATQDVRQRLEATHGTNGGVTADWSGGNGFGSGTVFRRYALTAFPSVPPPRIQNPFSLTHVANGLSLLATAFRGGKIPR